MRDQYHLPGVLIKHRRDAPTSGQQIKAMAKLAGKDILPEVEMPRSKRAYKPRPGARKPHQQHEKHLQKQIVHYLRLKGCVAGRVKTSGTLFQGRYLKDDTLFVGVPDILAFHPRTGMHWIECKWGDGKLSKEQALFRLHCQGCNIQHIIARSLADVEIILASPVELPLLPTSSQDRQPGGQVKEVVVR
jgi:hypothetical protein